eukprot:gnl/Chilomastix_cuspidata/3779.p1 GENE.gnl/Chilomastix_cuspidata/3779~~gnl/Chilomastix_cuspidata/3779.p1  ORF type:complete len:233 (-),score=0.87 gnl/Chilomastix_cuspidata/3779:30-728(-)
MDERILSFLEKGWKAVGPATTCPKCDGLLLHDPAKSINEFYCCKCDDSFLQFEDGVFELITQPVVIDQPSHSATSKATPSGHCVKPPFEPIKNPSEASSRIADLLARGWRMLASQCQGQVCHAPMMQSPAGGVWCPCCCSQPAENKPETIPQPKPTSKPVCSPRSNIPLSTTVDNALENYVRTLSTFLAEFSLEPIRPKETLLDRLEAGARARAELCATLTELATHGQRRSE